MKGTGRSHEPRLKLIKRWWWWLGGGAMKLKGQYSFSFVAPPFPTKSPVNRVTNGHQFPVMASTEPEVLPQCRMGRTQISDEAYLGNRSATRAVVITKKQSQWRLEHFHLVLKATRDWKFRVVPQKMGGWGNGGMEGTKKGRLFYAYCYMSLLFKL